MTAAARQNQARLAVLIPCYNEELTVGSVVKDYRRAFPSAEIYVYDNVSTDRTAEVARAAGATVVFSPRRGKGNVVQHMFTQVEADYYVMTDGDMTYPADDAVRLLELLKRTNADMACGARLKKASAGSFRFLHNFGNHLITGLVSALFRVKLKDILTGSRVMSRDLVKNLPLQEEGFEVETEMTLQALTKGFQIVEGEISYGERPEGSVSKLSTFSDGFLIFKLIFLVFKDYKPLFFFGSVAALLAVASLGVGIWPILDYIRFKFVYKVPLAILSTGLGILATLSLAIGLILDSVYKYHHESYVLWRMERDQRGKS
jgi:glycosyltransferase involved in cell wall biosynthesis